MPGTGLSFVANGNIQPSRFVKLDASATTTVGKVIICGAGDKPVGISGQGSRNAPYSSLDDGYHAIAGENCRVYTEGEVCWVESGGVFAQGDRLKSGALGVAVVTTTTQETYGAIALENSTGSGKLVKVQVVGQRDIG